MIKLNRPLINAIPKLLCCVLLAPASAFCQDRLNDSVQRILRNSKTAGAAVTVLKNEELAYTINYGFADLEEKKPVTNETEFGIMSVSKNIVACAALQLVTKDLLNLDEPVTKYIRGLPESYKQIKIFELLNHTSGVPDYVHVKGYMQQADQMQKPMELLQSIFKLPLEFIPGTKNSYSNSNYILMGLVIEKASRKKLGLYLKNNIFDPLGMKHTYLEETLTARAGKAKGYSLQNDQLVIQQPLNPSQYWAAGGIVSTAHDLATYDRALKNGSILPVRDVKQMMTATKLPNGENNEYGLGFELLQSPDLSIAGNTGVGLGYNAAYLSFINDGITIIVLTNTSNGKSGMIAKQIYDLISPHREQSKTRSGDRYDEIVMRVFKNAAKGLVDVADFSDDAAAQKFKENNQRFIQQQGALLTVDKMGEKINPETIVRRYQINFAHNQTGWVIIFSKEGKIVLANHM